MNWKTLNTETDLIEAIEQSVTKPVVIFKHSIRCSISSVIKNRLEKANQPEEIDFYYLDLITYRNLSNQIAENFLVHHESPQVLVIRNKECIYDESHYGITMEDIISEAERSLP